MATAKPKLPVIEYYWRRDHSTAWNDVVCVRILAPNGEIVGQITQGSQDKRDARRCVNALINCLGGFMFITGNRAEYVQELIRKSMLKECGPGPKPKLPNKL